MTTPKKSRLATLFSWEVCFILGFTVFTAVLYFFAVPFMEMMELKAYDLHFRERGKVEPSGVVAFVSVDEESVNRVGRWPWPRREMALLLKAVEVYGARSIGLDLGFFEPDTKLRRQAILDLRDYFKESPEPNQFKGVEKHLEAIADEEDDDRILAETIQQLSIPTVLGHFFYARDSTFLPPPPPADVLDKAAFPVVQIIAPPRPGSVNEAGGLEYNIPEVRKATPWSGSFNVFADPDGTVRWMPLVIRYGEQFFPSVALETLAAGLPGLPLILKVDDLGVKDIRLGPVSIPTNNRGEMLVNFAGPGYTFPHFSAATLMKGEAPPGCLEGKFIIIGNTTMGLHDMRPTAFDPVFPGLELHCTVMESILQQKFLQRSERVMPIYDMVALLGLALAFLIAQKLIRGIPLAAVVLGLLGGYIALTHLLFLREGMWINHVYPTANLFVAYLGTTVHRYVVEERDKKKIRETFGLYVNPSVVDQMLAHPEMLRLGGEKRELSVLFSDIRGFTSLSEKLPPEELVPQLNHYLTRMTQVVFDHLGTLDKYIGDAVMAIFGAPIPQEDHAVRACSTALHMMAALEELHAEWAERGLPALHIGIGINTGMMMVGNMGSERRFDYTVLGDNVNLASRLEGLTKMYGVSVVASEATWLATHGAFVGRELDVVRVKGKQLPVPIFQVMARAGEKEALTGPLAFYNEAMDLFKTARWDEAEVLFQKVLDAWPQDTPSTLYLTRCRELREQCPGADWCHITTLDHK